MSVTCKLSVFSSALSCAAAHSEKFHVGSLVHGNHRKTISFLNVPIPVHLHNALLLLCTVTTKALMNKVSSNIKVKSWCVCVFFLQFSTANLSFLLFSNALPLLPPRNCNFPPLVEPLMKNSFLRSRSRYPWSFHDSNFQAKTFEIHYHQKSKKSR